MSIGSGLKLTIVAFFLSLHGFIAHANAYEAALAEYRAFDRSHSESVLEYDASLSELGRKRDNTNTCMKSKSDAPLRKKYYEVFDEYNNSIALFNIKVDHVNAEFASLRIEEKGEIKAGGAGTDPSAKIIEVVKAMSEKKQQLISLYMTQSVINREVIKKTEEIKASCENRNIPLLTRIISAIGCLIRGEACRDRRQ